MHGEHQDERDGQHQDAGDQGGRSLDQETADLGGVRDPGVEFAGAPPCEEGGRQPEKVLQIAQDQARIERQAQPERVEDASVADQQRAGHHGQHQCAGAQERGCVAGREDPVDDMLQEQRGAEPGHDIDDRAGQHQAVLFPG